MIFCIPFSKKKKNFNINTANESVEEGSATLGIARNIKDISHPEKERNI